MILFLSIFGDYVVQNIDYLCKGLLESHTTVAFDDVFAEHPPLLNKDTVNLAPFSSTSQNFTGYGFSF